MAMRDAPLRQAPPRRLRRAPLHWRRSERRRHRVPLIGATEKLRPGLTTNRGGLSGGAEDDRSAAGPLPCAPTLPRHCHHSSGRAASRRSYELRVARLELLDTDRARHRPAEEPRTEPVCVPCDNRGRGREPHCSAGRRIDAIREPRWCGRSRAALVGEIRRAAHVGGDLDCAAGAKALFLCRFRRSRVTDWAKGARAFSYAAFVAALLEVPSSQDHARSPGPEVQAPPTLAGR